jgi:hypothetical protein
MTPEEFITTWTKNDLTERAGAQAFIEDLCELLGLEKPRDSETFCYEKGAVKDSGRRGWADVWKKDHFAWENKKPRSDLKRALAQLREYSGNLENPPLLIVCDRERIEIHTVFRGFPDEPRTILLSEIGNAKNLEILRWVFTDPDKLKPLKSNAAITAEAAAKFAYLAGEMRGRGLEPQVVAHFLTQCVFCMFAEDAGLLIDAKGVFQNENIFTTLLKVSRTNPSKAVLRLEDLFSAMQEQEGMYGYYEIAWFNGGLFQTIEIPELNFNDVAILFRAADEFDWRAIDPTIFGTLFERGLDPEKERVPLGAHYTDIATINKLIEPLISRPLAAKWQLVKAVLEKSLGKSTKTKEYKNAVVAYQNYLEELRNFRVLDAACGSGNFLYLALHALKDLEHRAQLDAEILGFAKQIIIGTGTHNVLGIETNEYAAELARVTVWIGDIQWCQRNGRPINKNPILTSLDSIERRDALINTDGTEAQWPEADVIVGNPPFLGDKKMLKELGDDYVATLRNCYKGRVLGGADLVCYWFDKARKQIEQNKATAAGLVSTNSIRGGANRAVLDAICKTMPIFEALSDERWFDNGTAVRVSLVCFGHSQLETTNLDNKPVTLIHADLTAGTGIETDITQAKILSENTETSFIGTQKNGAFDVDGNTARQWLKQPNTHGKANSEVVRPWANGMDITRRPSDTWIVDFGVSMSEDEASLFELPFEWVLENVKPIRLKNREEVIKRLWWLHKRKSPALRAAISPFSRFIATSMVSKHRFFVWLPKVQIPENLCVVIARADDTTFGILHSRFHELWSLALCTWLGKGNDPRYTPTTCFETFPFPEGLTPADTNNSESKIAILDSNKPTPAPVTNPETMIHAQAIAEAAFKLNDYREKWLNPSEWVDWVITPEEEVAGFPKRPKAKPGQEANLKKRTLTNLYNARPAALKMAHQELDKAVAAAYGWDNYTPEMTDAEILQRLLILNLTRQTDKKTT